MLRRLFQIALLVSPVVSAQSQESASLKSLTDEVHQLRLSVERALSTLPRMQIALQRLQLQEQKVAELVQQHDELQTRIARATDDQATTAKQAAGLERSIREEQDPSRLRTLKMQHSEEQQNAERQARNIQTLTTQEADKASALRLEQSKRDELSERLTALERSLDASK